MITVPFFPKGLGRVRTSEAGRYRSGWARGPPLEFTRYS